MAGGEGSVCLGYGSDERLFLSIYYVNILRSKKYVQSVPSLVGCPWGAGYGILRPPRALVPSPTPQKDVSHVATPFSHGACAGGDRPGRPCRLSSWQSVCHPARYTRHHLLRCRLCRALPPVWATGLVAVAAGARDHHAVSREAGRSPSRRRRPGPHRLEVSPGVDVDGSRFSFLRAQRVSGPPLGRGGRRTAAGETVASLSGVWHPHSAQPAADRCDARVGRHPGAQSPRTPRGNAARDPERPGHGRARLAARDRSTSLV